VCVVELEGSRVLVPACSRKVEPGMRIHTDSERVRLSRRLVLEFLASSVDVSAAPALQEYMRRYGADPRRFGSAATRAAEPPKIDNDLYVRDYAKCILCYKCVEACGVDAQNTFAISAAGRGFSAHIATEFDVPLPESACVYCGNCIGVCPTGALVFKTEFDMRKAGSWDQSRQSQTDTICPYCGVGCTLTVHEQDGRPGRVTSPLDYSVTRTSLHQGTLRLGIRGNPRQRARSPQSLRGPSAQSEIATASPQRGRAYTPLITPSSSTSIDAARDTFGRPGINIMFPQITTTKPAPAESEASVTRSVQPVGAPKIFGSSVKEYCVLAMQTGTFA